MSNVAEIIRGAAYTFRVTIGGAVGTETMKLVVGATDGAVGTLVKSLSYNSTLGKFTCTLTAANTLALTANRDYEAVVWRTDSGSEDVPVSNGIFKVRAVPMVA